MPVVALRLEIFLLVPQHYLDACHCLLLPWKSLGVPGVLKPGERPSAGFIDCMRR